MRKLVSAIIFGAAAILAAGQAYAEQAASIDYQFVNRPPDLPDAFIAPTGASLRFLAIKAIDQFQVDAALWQPADNAPSSTTLIVGVHGVGGNFFSRSPIASVSPLLVAKRFAVLTISTRWHDQLRNSDNFFEARRDIEAAIYTARALGYKTIVLWGHSLGNIHVQYYAANTWDADIKAVVLSGMFANLPWRSRYILEQNEDAFRRLSDAALSALREGKENEYLANRMREPQGGEGQVSARHFLTYRSEASSAAQWNLLDQANPASHPDGS